MTCNCNRTGDVEYTIILNQQGPQGRQGNVGQTGFSPIISVQSNTEANYQLKIITDEGEIITPNLKGQNASLPTGTANLNTNNIWTGTNAFTNNVEFGNGVTIEGTATVNGNQVITELEFDELADDVVDINSALGGLNFKKYTEEEYASIATPDANTLYMVTNPDGNTFKLYLGSIELEGGGGGTIVYGDNASQRSYITNLSTTVTAEPYA